MRGQRFISRATPTLTDNGYVEVIGPEGALKASLSRGTVDVLKASSPAGPARKLSPPLPQEAHDGKPHCLTLMMRSFVDACLRGSLDDNEKRLPLLMALRPSRPSRPCSRQTTT